MCRENEQAEVECVECGPYSDVELMYEDVNSSYKEYACRNCGVEWTQGNEI